MLQKENMIRSAFDGLAPVERKEFPIVGEKRKESGDKSDVSAWTTETHHQRRRYALYWQLNELHSSNGCLAGYSVHDFNGI
ncbi:hypothetical protein LSTR_LSTR016615 [Laodelphax striatellus]|uniref:Uncharacterized protein n=1 Tax=Laodelphax striatellus TaxID=195883 RepID=A0A482WZ81_LAOST|nr:hypothetical protein LSTR_LSTR016615 [Laodelphax striatellus]